MDMNKKKESALQSSSAKQPKAAKQPKQAKKETNASLTEAKRNKDDEFYTQLSDIEAELAHYRKHFRDKVIFCNCDDPEWSSFWKFFTLNFHKLGLKKVVSTHYEKGGKSYKLEFESDGAVVKTPLNGDGDFRSPECIAILNDCDIVVTNPPFSLFREFLSELVKSGKKFLIISNKNAVSYKEVFQLMKSGKLWVGYRNINSDMWFILPDSASKWEKIKNGKKMQHIMGCWLTNLDHSKRSRELVLYKKYDSALYPKYDGYDIINVNKVEDIPMDYDKPMGVPITFIDKFNPAQFELLGIANSARWIDYECLTLIKGVKKYNRLIIRKVPQK